MIAEALLLLAVSTTPIWGMAKTNRNLRSNGSPSKRKPSSPKFNKGGNVVSVTGGGAVNVKFEAVVLHDRHIQIVVYWLERGESDGFSKPINDAIFRMELTEEGFYWAECTRRLSLASETSMMNAKGWKWRCFPQFVADSKKPNKAPDRLATAQVLADVLSQPSVNQYNVEYRAVAANDMTRDPPRSADHLLTTEVIVTIIKQKYNLEDSPSFYAAYPDLAQKFFDAEANYPHLAISQLGYPSIREEVLEEEDEDEEEDEEENDNSGEVEDEMKDAEEEE
jgi:hypothetical protein